MSQRDLAGQLKTIASKLKGKIQKDATIKSLKEAEKVLQGIEQGAPASTIEAIKPFGAVLVTPSYLRHHEREVRLLVLSCLSDILRIYAPEPPYADETLKAVFQLFVDEAALLKEVHSPSFLRRATVLENLAKVKTCVVMLDLQCDDLILEMFRSFFDVAKAPSLPENVQRSLSDVMACIIEESDETVQPWLDTILHQVHKNSKGKGDGGHQLACDLVSRCADRLQPSVQRLFMSCMAGASRQQGQPEFLEDYHELVFQLYLCAPTVLLTVLPHFQEEMVAEQVDQRIKAVKLLGRLFALPDGKFAHDYRHLFSEFTKRFQDKAIDVRLEMVRQAHDCLLSSLGESEATELLDALSARLLDFDEKVRAAVVGTICDVAIQKPDRVSQTVLKSVSQRLRDKKVNCRKETLVWLLKVYSQCCTGVFQQSKSAKPLQTSAYEWIVSAVLKCCYDKEFKDFKPPGIELYLEQSLFSAHLPASERVQHWVSAFKNFDANDKKALSVILALKRRLQVEFVNFQMLRQKLKEKKTDDLQHALKVSIDKMAATFVDQAKAAADFDKLHVHKDNNVIKLLTELADPHATAEASKRIRDELTKKVSEKHPLHEFLQTLISRLGYNIFSKEHVQCLLSSLKDKKTAPKKDVVAACLSLLVEIAGYCPALLSDAQEDLLQLLRSEDEAIKDGAAQIMSHCGEFARDGDMADERPVEELKQMCRQGSRSQAKHAVTAIANMGEAVVNKVFPGLCKELVASLETTEHLPTVLQSLGCLAQHDPATFEKHEDGVVKFVLRNVFRRNSSAGDPRRQQKRDTPSPESILKVCGLKLLVRSFLLHRDRDGGPRSKLKGLLNVLQKLLPVGEVSPDAQSSDVDKGHLRLAAAKAVLRLARRFDSHMPPELYLAAMERAQDLSYTVRREFVKKVHAFLKERSLPSKYACALCLGLVDSEKDISADSHKYLTDYVDACRRDVRARLVASGGVGAEGASLKRQPEYMLTYLVWLLAHHKDFPGRSGTREAYAPFIRQLESLLKLLLPDAGSVASSQDPAKEQHNLPAVLAILRTLKTVQDASAAEQSENIHVLADMGIYLAQFENRKQLTPAPYPGEVPLSVAFFKENEAGAETNFLADGSHLPESVRAWEPARPKPRAVVPRPPQPAAAPRPVPAAGSEEDVSGSEDGAGGEGVRPDSPDAAEGRTPPSGAQAAARADDLTTSGQGQGSRRQRQNKSTTAQASADIPFGSRVEIFWPDDDVYYAGTTGEVEHKTGKLTILYDDNQKECLDMSKETWRFLDEGAAAAPTGTAEKKSKAAGKKAAPSPARGGSAEKGALRGSRATGAAAAPAVASSPRGRRRSTGPPEAPAGEEEGAQGGGSPRAHKRKAKGEAARGEREPAEPSAAMPPEAISLDREGDSAEPEAEAAPAVGGGRGGKAKASRAGASAGAGRAHKEDGGAADGGADGAAEAEGGKQRGRGRGKRGQTDDAEMGEAREVEAVGVPKSRAAGAKGGGQPQSEAPPPTGKQKGSDKVGPQEGGADNASQEEDDEPGETVRSKKRHKK